MVGSITQLQGGFEKRGIDPPGPTCSGSPRTLAEQAVLREPSTNRGLGWTRGFCGPRERPLAQTASFPPGPEPKTEEEDPRESEPKRDSCISGSGESWFCWGGGTGRGAAQSPRSGNWSSVAPSHILGSRKSWEPGLGCQPRSSRVQDGLGPRGVGPRRSQNLWPCPQNRKAAPVGRAPARGKSLPATAPAPRQQVGSCFGAEVRGEEGRSGTRGVGTEGC